MCLFTLHTLISFPQNNTHKLNIFKRPAEVRIWNIYSVPVDSTFDKHIKSSVCECVLSIRQCDEGCVKQPYPVTLTRQGFVQLHGAAM